MNSREKLFDERRLIGSVHEKGQEYSSIGQTREMDYGRHTRKDRKTVMFCLLSILITQGAGEGFGGHAKAFGEAGIGGFWIGF